MDFLLAFAVFILTISVLVGFHEYGHFWAAQRCGVRVLRFSIGFGKPIWLWRSKNGVEYVVAAIPLGGYVKMLDKREAPVSESEMSQEFNSQPLIARTAIIAAGPLFNFILALLLYFSMYIIGASATLPIVGPVTPGSPAADSGIGEGDQIIRVNNRAVATWREAMLELINADPSESALAVTLRDADHNEQTVFLDMRRANLLGGNASDLENLGLQMAQPKIPPFVGKTFVGSAAQRGGLIAGDKIITFNSYPVASWQELVQQIHNHPEQLVDMTLERDGRHIAVSLQLDSALKDGRRVGQLGMQVQIDENISENYQVHRRYGMLDSFVLATQKTWRMTVLMLKVIWRMLTGNASVSNVGGPLSIAQYASLSFAAGISSYLGMLALLSISLGILNLLPVPMLDGGHLLYCLIELFKGSPVSETAQLTGSRVGLFLILSLMFFAIYNDLYRFLS